VSNIEEGPAGWREFAGALALIEMQLSGAAESSNDEPGVEFRSDPTRSGMPDAIAVVQHDGVYLCVNGGDGRIFLGQAIARLVANFGRLTIDDCAIKSRDLR
jgi:hypothetical protein